MSWDNIEDLKWGDNVDHHFYKEYFDKIKSFEQ